MTIRGRGYFDTIQCEVHPEVKLWYKNEAKRESIETGNRIAMADIIRDALQYYIESKRK